MECKNAFGVKIRKNSFYPKNDNLGQYYRMSQKLRQKPRFPSKFLAENWKFGLAHFFVEGQCPPLLSLPGADQSQLNN